MFCSADKTEMDENASQSKAEKSPSFSFLVVKPINGANFAGLNLGKLQVEKGLKSTAYDKI